MYVSIKAMTRSEYDDDPFDDEEDEDNVEDREVKSKGNTRWVETDIAECRLKLDLGLPNRSGSADWHVEITDRHHRVRNSGARYDDPHVTHYQLTLRLTPGDLAALVNFASENRLIEPVVKLQVPKKRRSDQAMPMDSVAKRKRPTASTKR